MEPKRNSTKGVNPRRLAALDSAIIPNMSTPQLWDHLVSTLNQLQAASKGDLTFDQRRRQTIWALKLATELKMRGVQIRLQF